MLRLTATGAALVDRIEAGDTLAEVVGTNSPSAVLLDRFLDAGICHPAPEPGTGPAASEVIVVVPVFNRPSGLARTLAAIGATGPDVAHIVVVDDGSDDADAHQRAVAESCAKVPFPIDLVRHAINGGPAQARNTGAAAAGDARLVAFVDAGCEPQQGWLDALLRHFADDRVALVAPRIVADGTVRAATANTAGAAATARTRQCSALGRYEAARSSLDLGPDPAPVRPRSKVPYVPSTTFVVRADALTDVGRFDETLRVGEDVDLVWRLHEAGHRLRYEPSATVAHDHPTALADWASRRFAYGTSAAPLAQRHPGNLAPLGVSGWSAALWGAVAGGRPDIAALVAAGSTAALARKLHQRGIDRPVDEAVLLAGRGHLGAGRLIASAALRAWLPITVGAALVSRRARRVALAAVVIPPLIEWVQRRPDLDPVRYVTLATLDDAAYGLGVWKGVIASGTWDPIVPTFTNWKA